MSTKSFKHHAAAGKSLEAAVKVATGFQSAVDNMNKGFTDRLHKILKVEQDKKERLRKAEEKRVADREKSLKGQPFKLSMTRVKKKL